MACATPSRRLSLRWFEEGRGRGNGIWLGRGVRHGHQAHGDERPVDYPPRHRPAPPPPPPDAAGWLRSLMQAMLLQAAADMQDAHRAEDVRMWMRGESVGLTFDEACAACRLHAPSVRAFLAALADHPPAPRALARHRVLRAV